MKRKEWLLVLALCLLAGGYALVMVTRTRCAYSGL